MPPVTVLNVAEKPSVARALTDVFKNMPGSVDRGQHRTAAQIFTIDGVKFPGVFRQGEGRMTQGPMEPHTMIVTSVRGHLASQDFPPDYGWSSCPPITLFDAPIETTYRSDMEPLEQMLRQQAPRARALVLWLDCDREGEAIADEVRSVCLQGNPQLSVYRAKFSTVLPREIQRALQTLGRVNENFVQAVQARTELDLRVGAAFTRFQTLRLQKKFDNVTDGVVSYGPCQFPTLGFVVERWARIETFVPEDFWFIELTLRVPPQTQQPQTSSNGNNHNNVSNGTNNPNSNTGAPQGSSRPIHFTWKRNRLYDQVSTMVLYDSCLNAREAVVTQLTGRPKNKWRPVPLATVELQKRASRYLRIGSETLMTAAEELYQQGYISYPRTETERFRPEFQHRPIIQDFAALGGQFGDYASTLLNDNGFQNPRAGQHDDNAHPPISPCKAANPDSINDMTQRGVYTLVVKHYLACCSRDAIGKETQLTVKMASEEFTAKGLMIVERNWLEIYAPWERWSTGQGELPPLQVGSRVTPSSLLMKQGTTSPPQLISEVELITLMDRNGIGTDATIAQHISTIQDRAYATKDAQQKFLPTKLGIALVEGYNSMGYQLNKPDLRRETEHECNLVAAGNKTKDQIMAPILAKMLDCFRRANAEVEKLDQAVGRHFPRLGASNDATVLQARFSECGACQGAMALKQMAGNNRNNRNAIRRKLLFCETCRTGLPLPRGEVQPMTDNDNGGNNPFRCPICQYQVIKILRGDGYTGNGYQVCPKCFSDPPVEHGGEQSGGDFRCFSCSHPSCKLAGGTQGGDISVFPCPFCRQGRQQKQANIMLRKTSRGHVLSCNSYTGGSNRGNQCQYTVWLPKEASSISIPNGDGHICRRCSLGNNLVRTVQFVFRPGSVPPHIGRECTVCILCDSAFRQDLNISLPQQNQVTTHARRRNQNQNQNTGRGRGGQWQSRGIEGNGSGGNARQNGAASRNSTGGGNTCYRCGQEGHFANNCPQNTR